MSISISNKFLNSNNSNISDATNISYKAKLRRLKMEETFLLQNINNSHNNSEADSKNYLTLTEFKKFSDDTKKSFNVLKQLYLDIKASTSSMEVLKQLDIDDIKKNIFELEHKIKMFKIHLQKELTALKYTERQLNQKLKDPDSIRYSKKKSSIPITKYTEIVPSPVKTLMTSPLKSSAVYEFQEFMRTSKNRYGGWDEYHHNIFVNIWRKHFESRFHPENELTTEDTIEFSLFLHELLPKLLGVSEEEVKLHTKWYAKYLYLKHLQQKAIDNWRSNKKKMKPSNVQTDMKLQKDSNVIKKTVKKKNYSSANDVSHQAPNNLGQKVDSSLDNSEPWCSVRFTRKCECDEMQQESMRNKGAINNEAYVESNEQTELHFLKSTKQWNIRCSSHDIKTDKIFNIENIKKLGTPHWRARL